MLLLAMGIFLFQISGYYPHVTEKIYSSYIYKLIGHGISSMTGFLPFSLAEVAIVGAVIFTFGYFFANTLKLFGPGERDATLKRLIINLFTAAGIIYFSFQILWGINYNRVELLELLGLEAKASTTEELYGLCEDLLSRANELRKSLDEDENGVMKLPYGKLSALDMAYKGFERASHRYPHLEGKYGKPKRIILSEPMCYTGITGFFFPFTGEANINMAIPEPLFAFTVTNEMAHQRGFAREEEANFIAYVTCVHHPDEYFQYAGTLSALIYSMNALGKVDEAKYRQLADSYDEGVARDLRFQREFWSRYSGTVQKTSDRINDTYLKSQNQSKGVASYGAMVDLLIAEYRQNISQGLTF